MIELSNVTAGYGGKDVLKSVSLGFPDVGITGILGPNGSGKSTLLKVILGILPVKNGTVLIDSKDIKTWNRKALARKISLVPQQLELQFDHLVYDFLLMGRYPYLGYFQNYADNDRKVVEDVIDTLQISHLQYSQLSQLSGGERQIVSIARALVQQTSTLLMDEAFNHLDVNHQLEIIQLIKDILVMKERKIILVSHNINLIAELCDNVILMKNGEILTHGNTESMLSAQNLRYLFNTKIKLIINPETKKPLMVY